MYAASFRWPPDPALKMALYLDSAAAAVSSSESSRHGKTAPKENPLTLPDPIGKKASH